MGKFSVGRLEEEEEPVTFKRQRRARLLSEEQEEDTHQVANYDYEEEERPVTFNGPRRLPFSFDSSEEEQEDDGDGIVNEAGSGEKADLGVSRPPRSGTFSMTVTDPEVFDCPICFDSLTTPVFQCENGHIACSTCCTKIMNKCPSCCTPIGYNRCRAIEKVLDSVKVTCRNRNYGCKVTVSYGKKHDHQKICPHAPCFCPNCNFVGSAYHLYIHFSAKHKDSAVYFRYNEVVQVTLNVNNRFIVLQEEGDAVLFILCNRSESLGHVISVSCIAPLCKRGSFYSIVTGPAGSTVRFQSFTKNIQICVDDPPSTGFLLVPIDSFGSSGNLKLELRIRL